MLSKAVFLKLFLVGLVVLLSTWLYFSFSLPSRENESQVDLFSSDSVSINDERSQLPEAGTYTLHKIFPAPKGQVLNSKGVSQPLDQYTSGEYTLLTFFYQHCSDADGCPYAITVFNTVKAALEKDPSLAKSVRLVNISFDPYRDTPMMIAGLEKQMNGHDKPGNVAWNFLTTSDVDELMPLIKGFNQNVEVVINPNTGDQTMIYQHVLKVFLLDKAGFVREIYSTAYMSPEMLLNDIKTLAMEDSH